MIMCAFFLNPVQLQPDLRMINPAKFSSGWISKIEIRHISSHDLDFSDLDLDAIYVYV